jgi:hypothetical protein
MKQLTLNVADHKLQTFLDFIEDLNYVKVVETPSKENEPLSASPSSPDSDDFMALAGMWEGRDISAEELRTKAWPTRK